MTGVPKDILIVGAGVFGLGTALELLERPAYDSSRITIIDSAAVLPNPVGSSVDASRIIRADYAQPTYSKLACEAQTLWRDQTPSGWGGEGRYSETGFVLTGDQGQADYVKASMKNVQDLANAGLEMDIAKIAELSTPKEIMKATGLPGVSGDTGYANWNSGWADAEKCVAFALKRIRSHPNAWDRVTIRSGCEVVDLICADDGQCIGVQLKDGSKISADLTVLATGAWTPSIYLLENRCLATGQVIAYLEITEEEQRYLAKRPVVINFARGTFIIPPQGRELKIARHGYGYRNPEQVQPAGSYKMVGVSIPKTDCPIPVEAEHALRVGLEELFPPDIDNYDNTPWPASMKTISKRPFTKTRICWYNDTPSGNFLIDYPPLPNHPDTPNTSLFVATGGSGHGFKFFPNIGQSVVNAIENKLAPEYRELWAWPDDQTVSEQLKGKGNHADQDGTGGGTIDEASQRFLECRDGSRSGPRGMILKDELAKGAASIGVAAGVSRDGRSEEAGFEDVTDNDSGPAHAKL